MARYVWHTHHVRNMAQLLTQSAVLEGFRSEFKHLQRSAMQVGGEARLILDPRVAFQDHLLLYTSDQGFQSTNPLPPPVCLYQWNCCLLQTSIPHPSFFFFGCARSMWKSPGQGLNLSHKGNPPHLYFLLTPLPILSWELSMVHINQPAPNVSYGSGTTKRNQETLIVTGNNNHVSTGIQL